MKIGQVDIPNTALIAGAAIVGFYLVSGALRDRNGDGKADGLFGGVGQDIGSAPVELIGGVLSGAVGAGRAVVGLGATPSACRQVYLTNYSGSIGISPENHKRFKMWLYCDTPAYEAWRDNGTPPK